MLCYRNISILIIVPFRVISEHNHLCRYTASLHGKYIHVNHILALVEQLEKNAQYHLNHPKWDFSSQIYMAQSKVEHWHLFCKLGLYRQTELNDSACHNSQLRFIFQDALRLNPYIDLNCLLFRYYNLCQHRL